jgi:hypothetical protein
MFLIDCSIIRVSLPIAVLDAVSTVFHGGGAAENDVLSGTAEPRLEKQLVR